MFSKSRLGAYFILFLAAACIAGTAAHYTVKKPAGSLQNLEHDSIIIDLPSGGYRATPVLADIARHEHFDEMMTRIKPHAAIIGTYYGADMQPIGDILINGKLLRRGGQRQGIGFTSSGKVVFRERRGSSRMDWSGCENGIACGPRLLRDGQISIDVVADGFKPGANTLEARRCAVGATVQGKLVMLCVREAVTLNTLAQAMLELGAVDAINLDGGGLCGLYAKNKCLVQPVLPVSSVLAVYKTK